MILLLAAVASAAAAGGIYMVITRPGGKFTKFALVGLILLWWRDVALTPVVGPLIDYSESSAAGNANDSEFGVAILIITVGYLPILFGLWVVDKLAYRYLAYSSVAAPQEHRNNRFIVATAIFAVGLIGQCFIRDCRGRSVSSLS